MEAISPEISYWEMHLNDLCQLASTDYRKVEYRLTEDSTGIPTVICDLVIDDKVVMRCNQPLPPGRRNLRNYPHVLKDTACRLMSRIWILYGIENMQRVTNHAGLANTIHQIQSKE